MITPEDVLMNILGLADDKTRAAIADAKRRHDPRVLAIEAELLPESTDETSFAAEDWVPQGIADYLDERWNMIEMIEEVGALIAAKPEGRLRTTRATLPVTLLEARLGVLSTTGQLQAIYGFDGGQRSAVGLPAPPYVVVANSKVYIGYGDAAVPFGLVRIVACRDGVPRASAMRVLEYRRSDLTWRLEIPIAEIFAGDVETSLIKFHVVPALADPPELRSWFPVAEVEALLSRIPETWTEERRRVAHWLE